MRHCTDIQANIGNRKCTENERDEKREHPKGHTYTVRDTHCVHTVIHTCSNPFTVNSRILCVHTAMLYDDVFLPICKSEMKKTTTSSLPTMVGSCLRARLRRIFACGWRRLPLGRALLLHCPHFQLSGSSSMCPRGGGSQHVGCLNCRHSAHCNRYPPPPQWAHTSKSSWGQKV